MHIDIDTIKSLLIDPVTHVVKQEFIKEDIDLFKDACNDVGDNVLVQLSNKMLALFANNAKTKLTKEILQCLAERIENDEDSIDAIANSSGCDISVDQIIVKNGNTNDTTLELIARRDIDGILSLALLKNPKTNAAILKIIAKGIVDEEVLGIIQERRGKLKELDDIRKKIEGNIEFFRQFKVYVDKYVEQYDIVRMRGKIKPRPEYVNNIFVNLTSLFDPILEPFIFGDLYRVPLGGVADAEGACKHKTFLGVVNELILDRKLDIFNEMLLDLDLFNVTLAEIELKYKEFLDNNLLNIFENKVIIDKPPEECVKLNLNLIINKMEEASILFNRKKEIGEQFRLSKKDAKLLGIKSGRKEAIEVGELDRHQSWLDMLEAIDRAQTIEEINDATVASGYPLDLLMKFNARKMQYQFVPVVFNSLEAMRLTVEERYKVAVNSESSVSSTRSVSDVDQNAKAVAQQRLFFNM